MLDGFPPPATIDLVELELPKPLLWSEVVRSPKSDALPNVFIIIDSILFVPGPGAPPTAPPRI